MKVWILTKVIGKGTDEDPRRPYLPVNLQYIKSFIEDLGAAVDADLVELFRENEEEYRKKLIEGLEKLSDEEVRRLLRRVCPFTYSMLDLGNECLVRLSGKPEDIKKLIEDPEIKVLKDEEARKIIKSKYPNSDLEDLDVADIELEELAKAEGLDPHEIKRDVQVPTRGRRVLQCQEAHLFRVLAKKKKVDISDIEEHIELGSKHAFNRALARLRGKTGLRELYRRVRK